VPAAAPQPLLEATYPVDTVPLVTSTVAFNYAATPDGQRFLLVEPIEGAADGDEPLYLLTNWQSLLDPQ
jgi:hypothetical protein